MLMLILYIPHRLHCGFLTSRPLHSALLLILATYTTMLAHIIDKNGLQLLHDRDLSYDVLTTKS